MGNPHKRRSMKLTVEQVMEAIKDAGGEPREYSGRGMYGTHCLGMDTSRDMMGDMVAIAVSLMEYGAEPRDVKNWGEGTRYDNMGRGMILYWPTLELTAEQVKELGDEEDEDDDEDEDEGSDS
jgi:hypothetical protein